MFELDNSRKHFVPRFYLRGFGLGNRDDQIYVFDKENPTAGVAVRSIDNVEVSKDAYSVANDAIVTEREGLWSQVLNLTKELSVSDLNELISDRGKSATVRAWLARFVVDSRLRSRGYRKQKREHVKAMQLQLRAKLEELEADTKVRFPELDEQLQFALPQIKEMFGTHNDRKFEAFFLDPFLRGEEGERHYKWYEEGSWRFDAAPTGRKFITSDMPSNSLLLGPEPEYRNWMWFIVPLTADLQLIGMCGDASVESGLAPRVGEIDNRAMDLANVCVFQSAARFVFASSKAEILRASEQSAGYAL